MWTITVTTACLGMLAEPFHAQSDKSILAVLANTDMVPTGYETRRSGMQALQANWTVIGGAVSRLDGSAEVTARLDTQLVRPVEDARYAVCR